MSVMIGLFIVFVFGMVHVMAENQDADKRPNEYLLIMAVLFVLITAASISDVSKTESKYKKEAEK